MKRMKKMKRWKFCLAVLAVVLLCSMLTGCTAENPAERKAEEPVMAVSEPVPTEEPVMPVSEPVPTKEPDPDSDRVLSDGTDTEQDAFNTDPVPEGKPMPVEPGTKKIDKKKKTKTCTIMIECSTILDNMSELTDGKEEVVPADGVILPTTTVEFSKGESVFDVLQRACRDNKIHMESSFTPLYNSAYIEGINNLYEFDCGSLSGWMYSVNGWYPNYGCSRYELENGDVIEWHFTCDLGYDVGGGCATGE